jgi:hypothetical protein
VQGHCSYSNEKAAMGEDTLRAHCQTPLPQLFQTCHLFDKPLSCLFTHQATSIWTLHTSASSFIEFLCSSASPVIAMHTGALLSGKLFTSPTAPSIISVQNVGSTGVYWRTRYADVFLWVSGNHCTAVWDSSRPAWRLALHMYL